MLKKMTMLPLIALTYAVFLLMWLSDLYFTIKTVKVVGEVAEVNPIIKLVLKTRGRFIWLFKVIELGVFSYLIYNLSLLDEGRAFHILLLVAFIYSLVIAAGIKVYIDVVGGSGAVVFLFFCLIVCLLLFIYLNHWEYQNRVNAVSSLTECNSNYARLYVNCSTPIDVNQAQPKKYGLNLTIPR